MKIAATSGRDDDGVESCFLLIVLHPGEISPEGIVASRLEELIPHHVPGNGKNERDHDNYGHDGVDGSGLARFAGIKEIVIIRRIWIVHDRAALSRTEQN